MTLNATDLFRALDKMDPRDEEIDFPRGKLAELIELLEDTDPNDQPGVQIMQRMAAHYLRQYSKGRIP